MATMIHQMNGKTTNLIKKVVVIPNKLTNVITSEKLVNIDDLVLCDDINCDSGKICTGKVAKDGKFELGACPKCNGRGFRKK